jgi:hypothetical protein
MDGGLIVIICSVVALLVFVIGLTIMNSPVEKDEVTPEPISSEYKPSVRYVTPDSLRRNTRASTPVKASGSNDYNDTGSDLLTTAIVLSALNNTDDCRHEHNHSHVDTHTPIHAESPDPTANHGYSEHSSSYDSSPNYDGGSSYDSGGGSDCGSCDCGGGGCD